jgi:hypothetical protein
MDIKPITVLICKDLVPGGGIANGCSGRVFRINQVRAFIEYNKLSGISILSSFSTESIATIDFPQTWTPNANVGRYFWTPNCAVRAAGRGKRSNTIES